MIEEYKNAEKLAAIFTSFAVLFQRIKISINVEFYISMCFGVLMVLGSYYFKKWKGWYELYKISNVENTELDNIFTILMNSMVLMFFGIMAMLTPFLVKYPSITIIW